MQSVAKKIGKDNMLFWHELWLRGKVLKKLFSRFFKLKLQKNVTLKEC